MLEDSCRYCGATDKLHKILKMSGTWMECIAVVSCRDRVMELLFESGKKCDGLVKIMKDLIPYVGIECWDTIDALTSARMVIREWEIK